MSSSVPALSGTDDHVVDPAGAVSDLSWVNRLSALGSIS